MKSGLLHLFAWLALVIPAAPLPAQPNETSYWVWQRNTPLTPEETSDLAAQRVSNIYWQAGELSDQGGSWQWIAKYPVPKNTRELRFIPVVRLSSLGADPFSKPSRQVLIAAIAAAVAGHDEVQLDSDCPDRLLADYAHTLQMLHSLVPRVSVTALAGWSQLAAWNDLQHNVEEIVPMFYDLRPDPRLQAVAPPALLVPSDTAKNIADWKACKTRWLAGLPTFARVTIYDANGQSRGHLRAWNWDEVCFNKALSTKGQTVNGVTFFQVTSAGQIAGATLKKGDSLAVRWPDLAALKTTLPTVEKSSAQGIALFRLPDGSAAGGWSLPQLGNLDAKPHLVLQTAPGPRLELSNDAEGDLAPRLAGTTPLDRGYALEVDAPAAIFRDVDEGDFWRVAGHLNPNTKPVPVPVPLATRLTFWFSHLPARQKLATGLIQLAPGADFSQLRYRILNCNGATEWQSLH
jgi:hypothetical protein